MNKKFLIIISGKAEGCDYTIGCNTRVEEIEANSLEEAWEKYSEKAEMDFNFLKEDGGDYGYYIELGIKVIRIIEIIKERKIDVLSLQSELDQYYKEESDKENEVDEKKQYERLKKKYK